MTHDTYPRKPQGELFPQETQEVTPSQRTQETQASEKPFACRGYCPACPRCR